MEDDNKDKFKIHSTTDYEKFKYIKGNRAIVEAHVKTLSDQIAKKDFQIPIIVNEKMEVCEGQHRLEAYRLLGVPITYIIKEGLEIGDIREMNSTSRKWTMSEYMDTFNDVSAAPERIIRRCIQSIGTNALKTLYRLDDLGEVPGQSPFKHIFAPEDGKPYVYFTDIRFLVPNSIDQMRTLVGSKGADRGRMREAFSEMTGADPLTALSISDVCLPFLADLGEDSWQTGTGLNTDEIIVEVTMAVDPARVWKALLEPTLDEIFDMPKGGKGTAANIWGDVFIQNEALHDKMRKDGQADFLKILQLAYNWSNNNSRKRHKDAF